MHRLITSLFDSYSISHHRTTEKLHRLRAARQRAPNFRVPRRFVPPIGVKRRGLPFAFVFLVCFHEWQRRAFVCGVFAILWEVATGRFGACVSRGVWRWFRIASKTEVRYHLLYRLHYKSYQRNIFDCAIKFRVLTIGSLSLLLRVSTLHHSTLYSSNR
jgi:hypothetical protein